MKYKKGQRVKSTWEWFRVEGTVLKVLKGFGYIVEFDEKLPNEYAWNTDTTLVSDIDLEPLGTHVPNH